MMLCWQTSIWQCHCKEKLGFISCLWILLFFFFPCLTSCLISTPLRMLGKDARKRNEDRGIKGSALEYSWPLQHHLTVSSASLKGSAPILLKFLKEFIMNINKARCSLEIYGIYGIDAPHAPIDWTHHIHVHDLTVDKCVFL